MSRIVIEVYPNTHKTAHGNVLASIQEWAESYGYYAHTHVDKTNGDTRVDITRSSRKVEEITGSAAEYLLEAAAAKGISVERLIKEVLGNDK